MHKKGEKTTQVEIAARVGLDVSSVNKILNGMRGAKFREETVARVLRTARRMGYDFGRATRPALLAELRDLFPSDRAEDELADLRGVDVARVQAIKRLVWREANGK